MKTSKNRGTYYSPFTYKQSIDIYKREMEEREEHNEKLRRFRHDIKNHLIAIEKLALSKEYVRLRDYIHQLTDEKGVLQVTTISGNALIDGLLADKFDVARKYEIAVEYHIEIPTKLPFDDADLCIIVGNGSITEYACAYGNNGRNPERNIKT